jgi:hypothetical protein
MVIAGVYDCDAIIFILVSQQWDRKWQQDRKWQWQLAVMP